MVTRQLDRGGPRTAEHGKPCARDLTKPSGRAIGLFPVELVVSQAILPCSRSSYGVRRCCGGGVLRGIISIASAQEERQAGGRAAGRASLVVGRRRVTAAVTSEREEQQGFVALCSSAATKMIGQKRPYVLLPPAEQRAADRQQARVGWDK
jgi:hypothetical protein